MCVNVNTGVYAYIHMSECVREKEEGAWISVTHIGHPLPCEPT